MINAENTDFVSSSLKNVRSASGNPLRFLRPVEGRQRPPQHVEIVREAVQAGQHFGGYAVRLVSPQGGPFGAAADRAADVAGRDGRVSARNGEPGDRFERSLHRVDARFEPFDPGGIERCDLVGTPLAYGQQRLDVHQQRADAHQVIDKGFRARIRAQAVGQLCREGPQLIDRAVGFDPFVGFENPLAADERCKARIALFGIDFHIR